MPDRPDPKLILLIIASIIGIILALSALQMNAERGRTPAVSAQQVGQQKLMQIKHEKPKPRPKR